MVFIDGLTCQTCHYQNMMPFLKKRFNNFLIKKPAASAIFIWILKYSAWYDLAYTYLKYTTIQQFRVT